MRDEPECIGPAILDSYAEGNEFRFAQQHTADVLAARVLRPLLRAEDRLRDAERRAKYAKRRDLNGEFLALRGMLERELRACIEPKPESAVVRRLERVEANSMVSTRRRRVPPPRASQCLVEAFEPR
jgi:hypothetical protein